MFRYITKVSPTTSKLMWPMGIALSVKRVALGSLLLRKVLPIGILVLLGALIIYLSVWSPTKGMITKQRVTVSTGFSLSTITTPAANQTALIRAIVDIAFVDDRVYVQNYEGELLQTLDGGKSWLFINRDVSKDFDAFTFTGGYSGWAVDNDGKVWKTDDSGHTWVSTWQLKRQDPQEHFMGAHQIVFNGPTNGWVVEIWTVWRTQDSGLTWHEVSGFPSEMHINTIRKMYFLNSRLGWTQGDGVVLQTTNGGETWRSVTDSLNGNGFINMNAAYFLDENHGWISVSDPPKPYPINAVLVTKDGGKSWRSLNEFKDEEVTIYDIFFLDSQTGWMVGGRKLPDADFENGVLFKTQDGGESWQTITDVPMDDAFFSIRFTSAKDGWLTTDYAVLRTDDGGKSWVSVLSYPEVKHRNMQILGVE